MNLHKHTLTIGLAAALALALTPACGGPEDPDANSASSNSGDNSSNGNNNNTTPDPNNNNTTDTGAPNNNTTPDTNNNTTPGPNNNTTPPPNNNTTPPPNNNNTSEAPDCDFIAMYPGQVGQDVTGGGGVFAVGEDSYEADSGLQAVYDKVVAELDAGNIVPCPEEVGCAEDNDTELLELVEADQLQVTGAIITSTAFNRFDEDDNYIGATRLTFQDQQTGMLSFAEAPTMDVNGDPLALRVGMKVNFKVTAIKAFGGEVPQIAAFTDVEVTGEDVDVGVIEATGADITIEDHWQKLVRVHGVIEEVAIPSCGGDNVCYTFTHGEAGSEKSITLRSSSSFIEIGDCTTYVGPVGSFPGPLNEGANAQLDSVSFDWIRGPFKGN